MDPRGLPPIQDEMTMKDTNPDTEVNLQALYEDGGSPIYLTMTLEQAEMHVEFAANGGSNIMYRAFEKKPDGGEQFIQAWIVKDGGVQDYPEVTIPKEFF